MLRLKMWEDNVISLMLNRGGERDINLALNRREQCSHCKVVYSGDVLHQCKVEHY